MASGRTTWKFALCGLRTNRRGVNVKRQRKLRPAMKAGFRFKERKMDYPTDTTYHALALASFCKSKGASSMTVVVKEENGPIQLCVVVAVEQNAAAILNEFGD